MTDLSPTAHARQLAGIRARARHTNRCVVAGKLVATDPRDE